MEIKLPIKDMGPKWIGVDLDGTLARYDKYLSPTHIGRPIPQMVTKIKAYLSQGKTVKIFTARVSPLFLEAADADEKVVRSSIEKWCGIHIGQVLEITCIKDHLMVALWDDIELHPVFRR